MLPDDTRFITDEASLRALHPQPMLRATGKVLRVLYQVTDSASPNGPYLEFFTSDPTGRFLIIVANTAIGIFQELRAKRTRDPRLNHVHTPNQECDRTCEVH